MSLTGKLGAIDSQPGNMEPGLSVDLNQIVSQSLAFVQLAAGDSRRFEQSQSLAFVQVVAVSVVRPVSVNHTLGLSQIAAQGATFPTTVTDTLSLVGTAAAVKGIHVSVSESLGLIQAVDFRGPIYQTVPQSIVFAQSATQQGPIYQAIHDRLNLVEDVGGGNQNIYADAVDVLNFTQATGRVITVSISQSIAFTQVGERRNAISHTLALVQTASVGKGGDVEQDLGLTDVVSVQGIFNRSSADLLGLTQSVTYYIDSGCTRFTYTPFVGSSADPDFTPPSTITPTLGTSRLRLTYPFVSPSVSVTLRNPSFGDKDRLSFNRINRVTRGGTLIVFADPKWPKTQTLSLQVDNLNPNQAADMIAFLRASLGQEIGLLDWENRQWRGIITTPDARITHVGRSDRSVAFDFQGSLA